MTKLKPGTVLRRGLYYVCNGVPGGLMRDLLNGVPTVVTWDAFKPLARCEDSGDNPL